MSRLEPAVVYLGAKILPPCVAFRISRAAIATQGIGWAGPTGRIEPGYNEAYELSCNQLSHLPSANPAAVKQV